MSLRSLNLKLVGAAAGAGALAVGVVAGPAVAAGEETASVQYTCTTPFGNATPSATLAVNAPPKTVAAGVLVKLPTTTVFTLDANTTALATGVLGWDSFSGKITTNPSNGAVGESLSFPKTKLGNGAGGTTVANGKGNTLLRATNVGTYTLKVGDIGKVHLQGFAADGSKSTTADFPDAANGNGPCTNDAGKTTLKNASNQNATTKIVKDGTTTKASAAYSAAKKAATGTAKVSSNNNSSITPNGKVAFTLLKGGTKVKSATASLKKGVAKVTFSGVKAKGSYTIKASYGGSSNLKPSSDSAGFKVS